MLTVLFLICHIISFNIYFRIAVYIGQKMVNFGVRDGIADFIFLLLLVFGFGITTVIYSAFCEAYEKAYFDSLDVDSPEELGFDVDCYNAIRRELDLVVDMARKNKGIVDLEYRPAEPVQKFTTKGNDFIHKRSIQIRLHDAKIKEAFTRLSKVEHLEFIGNHHLIYAPGNPGDNWLYEIQDAEKQLNEALVTDVSLIPPWRTRVNAIRFYGNGEGILLCTEHYPIWGTNKKNLERLFFIGNRQT